MQLFRDPDPEVAYRQPCIKAAAFVQFFHVFGAASIQVRLLFDGGLYAKS